jgi:Phosphoinositide phospholipase C, Ca2+-dependent
MLLCRAATGDEPLRLNQIQVIGSHNSYKQAIDTALVALVKQRTGNALDDLDYAHPTLTDQLNLGLRSLELDVYNDPQGGRYASPLGLQWLRNSGTDSPPYDPEGLMQAAGFKVLHIPDLDFRSHNLTLASALAELRGWSADHPRHLPIVVTMNLKDGRAPIPGGVEAAEWDADALDELDVALEIGLGDQRLLTPDDVRGDRATLEEAILERGWPILDTTRGKFLFVLDEDGVKQRLYIAGHGSLRGRVMFTTSPPGQPEAAVQIINDPLTDHERIRQCVAKGYLVRTRADSGTHEARAGDYARFEAAKSSGAQVISTDYYLADWRLRASYRVRFENSQCVRINPVTGVAAKGSAMRLGE